MLSLPLDTSKKSYEEGSLFVTSEIKTYILFTTLEAISH